MSGYVTAQFPWFATVPGHGTAHRQIHLTRGPDDTSTLCGMPTFTALPAPGVTRPEVADGLGHCPTCNWARDWDQPIIGPHAALYVALPPGALTPQ